MHTACIQWHNYDLFEKTLLKLSPLIQNCVQQDYLPESYARDLTSYQKCHKIVAPNRCGLSPPSSELLWETLGMEKTPTQQLMVYSFKCNLDLYLQSLLLYHILNFRLYVHLFHANLTNQCLLNVAFNMTKALNVWSSPKRNFHSPHLSIPSLALMLFWKPCIYYCLFSSFPHSLFYSNLYKTSTDSTPIGVLCFAGKSAIVGLQVSWNKSYKTPYSMP